jgi:hypothetical protein
MDDPSGWMNRVLARLLQIYSLREFALAGGLLSYGPSVAEGYRLAGVYTGQILRGARPAELPVQHAHFGAAVTVVAPDEIKLTVAGDSPVARTDDPSCCRVGARKATY